MRPARARPNALALTDAMSGPFSPTKASATKAVSRATCCCCAGLSWRKAGDRPSRSLTLARTSGRGGGVVLLAAAGAALLLRAFSEGA